MSRTINNIGFASEECHVPACSGGPVSRSIGNESETSPCRSEVTENAGDAQSSVSMSSPSDSVCSAMDDVSCLYAKNIALMAVAKSQQMVLLPEDTFGDDDDDVDDGDDDDSCETDG